MAYNHHSCHRTVISAQSQKRASRFTTWGPAGQAVFLNSATAGANLTRQASRRKMKGKDSCNYKFLEIKIPAVQVQKGVKDCGEFL